MKINLLDYSGKIFEVEIPDSTEFISGQIISGDTVMEEPFFFDTGKDTRMSNFYDGSFEIPASKFEEMNNIRDSYKLFEL